MKFARLGVCLRWSFEGGEVTGQVMRSEVEAGDRAAGRCVAVAGARRPDGLS